MYFHKSFGFAGTFYILFFCFFVSSCALLSKQDSCKQEPLCELTPDQPPEPVELKIGEFTEVTVCACRPWNESGIQVLKGQQYSFKAEVVSDWIDGGVPADPYEGWQGGFYRFIGYLGSYLKRSEKADWYALVGSIDKNDEHTFAVVDISSDVLTMNRSGNLYFYANDKKGRYFNNKGKVALLVKREK